VFDDALTAPFLAKDVDKFWKPEHYENCFEVCQYISGAEFGFDDLDCYQGSIEQPALETAIEEYIKMREYPMGKVMNSLRLALTGAASGLGIAAIISFIGRKEFARRMTYVAERLGRK
jgi:glutamyl-tRNA synthetase